MCGSGVTACHLLLAMDGRRACPAAACTPAHGASGFAIAGAPDQDGRGAVARIRCVNRDAALGRERRAVVKTRPPILSC